MKGRGFALIEVLVALLICMIVFTAAARLSLFTMRSGSASDALTYAAVFGHSKLASLVNLPAASADLQARWHQDPANPIRQGGARFYRFWKVDDVGTEKRIVLYIAWESSDRERAGQFASEDEIRGSRCPKLSFCDTLVTD